MAYVGTPLDTTNAFQSLAGKRFSGDASTTDFTLDSSPNSTLDIEVFVENVRQDPNSAYTVSGTTLAFTGAPPSGTNNIYVVHQAKSVGTIDVPVGGAIDMNGVELVLDADADTTITADTDDQIDIKIAGADDFQFTANTFTAQSGSTITTPTLGVGDTKDLGSGLHIKTADSGASVDSAADELVIEGSGASGMTLLSGTSSSGSIYFGDSGDNDIGYVAYNHSGNYMMFGTNANERMRISSSGYLQIGTTSGSAQLDVEVSAAITGAEVTCTSGSYDANVINAVCSRVTTNETYNIYRGANGDGSGFFAVRDSGNVENANNSYGSSSDERIKQNIVDANSQWDDIKALKIRNYKLKKEVAKGVDKTYIGVVAQEVETAGMNGLIGGKTAEDKETVALSSDFGTLYEDGDVLPEGKKVGDIKTLDQRVKSVKYSILYMKAIKALQEAQTRIETLETEMTALKARVKTLEDA
jgi:hypothetical protein